MRSVKHIVLIGSLCVFALAPFLVAHAETKTYTPLAPLPGSNGQITTGAVNPSDYIINLIRIAIGVASGLAVLAIAYSGIKYMMSDVVTNKSDAVQGIKNALLGLLLALSAYLILYTINPKLTQLDILNTIDQQASACTWTITNCGTCANGVHSCNIVGPSPVGCTGGGPAPTNPVSCKGAIGASCTQPSDCSSNFCDGLSCYAL